MTPTTASAAWRGGRLSAQIRSRRPSSATASTTGLEDAVGNPRSSDPLRNDCLDYGLGLQARSSLLDPAARANLDHQKADGTDKMPPQQGSAMVIYPLGNLGPWSRPAPQSSASFTPPASTSTRAFRGVQRVAGRNRIRASRGLVRCVWLIISLTLERGTAFLLVAGDVYDGAIHRTSAPRSASERDFF